MLRIVFERRSVRVFVSQMLTMFDPRFFLCLRRGVVRHFGDGDCESGWQSRESAQV